MAFEEYRGLKVINSNLVNSIPGVGGKAINNDLVNLVNWNPKSKWDAGDYPSGDNDETENYQVGSRWFSPEQGLFLCTDNAVDSPGEAVWQGINVDRMGMTAKVTTTTSTYTQLLLAGGGTIDVPENTVWAFSITTIARRTDSGSNTRVWETRGVITRDSSNASINGTNQQSSWNGFPGTEASLQVIADGIQLKIQGKGTSPQVVDWIANVRIVQLTV